MPARRPNDQVSTKPGELQLFGAAPAERAMSSAAGTPPKRLKGAGRPRAGDPVAGCAAGIVAPTTPGRPATQRSGTERRTEVERLASRPSRGRRFEVKEFRCGVLVPGCYATFQAESDDEILRQVFLHAREEHGMDQVPPEVVDEIRAEISEREPG